MVPNAVWALILLGMAGGISYTVRALPVEPWLLRFFHVAVWLTVLSSLGRMFQIW